MDFNHLKKNQVFILGSNGFIGARLVRALQDKTYDIVTVDISNAQINIDLKNNNFDSLLDLVSADANIGIINCAGYNQKVEIPNGDKTSAWYDIEQWQSCLELNLTLPYRIANFAEKCLAKTSGKVDIIFLGSLYATRSPNNHIYEGVDGIDFKEPEYVASKHGIIGLTRALNALDLSERIRFNCISPGAVGNAGMGQRFKDNFQNISGGDLNDVDEIAQLIVQLIFRSWTLFRGANIEAYGGAFN